jgi:drug/metabolite transporter (DMT)-like permease
LNIRQYIGILVAILAGYTVINTPSLTDIKTMPLWVWLTVLNMLGVAINQGITQKIKSIDPFVKNFWGGLTAVVLGLACLFFVPLDTIIKYPALPKLVGVSILVGVIVIFLWCFNLLSYKNGAYITLKKIVTQGSYMVLAMLTGAMFFHESLTVLKMLGVVLYVIAFVMVDTITWNRLFAKSQAKQTSRANLIPK